jgi:uracil DNA glycosylase
MNWETIINEEQQKEYYKELENFIDIQYKTKLLNFAIMKISKLLS